MHTQKKKLLAAHVKTIGRREYRQSKKISKNLWKVTIQKYRKFALDTRSSERCIKSPWNILCYFSADMNCEDDYDGNAMIEKKFTIPDTFKGTMWITIILRNIFEKKQNSTLYWDSLQEAYFITFSVRQTLMIIWYHNGAWWAPGSQTLYKVSKNHFLSIVFLRTCL